MVSSESSSLLGVVAYILKAKETPTGFGVQVDSLIQFNCNSIFNIFCSVPVEALLGVLLK